MKIELVEADEKRAVICFWHDDASAAIVALKPSDARKLVEMLNLLQSEEDFKWQRDSEE